MIKIENVEVVGWGHAIRGMRNPKNSWEKSDSAYCGEHETCDTCPACDPDTDVCNAYDVDNDIMYPLIIGPKDHELMMKLAKGGSVHAKYRRMITVYVDITAPLYWWKEFDTYKVGTVANSCSTMHKIHEKEFTVGDFSYEHLMAVYDENGEKTGVTVDVTPYKTGDIIFSPLGLLDKTVDLLNICRENYLHAKIKPMKDESKRAEIVKKYWWQMIQLLPSSYNQKRTIMLNYEVLAGIYPMRKNHKLDEWCEFCKWIEGLPYSELILAEDVNE